MSIYHGEFEVQRCGRLILIKGMGAWNEERMAQFDCYLCNEFMVPLIGKEWSSVTDLLEWELAAPELFAILEHTQNWGRKNGLQYQAFVVKSELYADIFKHYGHLLNPQKTLFAKSMDEALAWFDSKGFKKEKCEKIITSMEVDGWFHFSPD